MRGPSVFISYSHKDEAWKDRLVTHLGVLQSQGLLDLWDDRRISAGQDWHQEIEQAMAAASVAIDSGSGSVYDTGQDSALLERIGGAYGNAIYS